MTEHIYRVLEIVGGEKSIAVKLYCNQLSNRYSVEVSLFLFGFKIIKTNKSQEIFTMINFRIASLYMITQRLKIFLLTNFDL